MTTTDATAILQEIAALVAGGQRFLITSHARPDGDSLGSSLAMMFALEALGREAVVVQRDPVPEPLRPFPGMDRILVTDRVEGAFDALFVMECGDLTRPGIAGLERYRVVNIDHHLGNTGYGAVNWFDETAAACGEMVADVIDVLGVPFTREIATHLYIAILTDTGSFRHSAISPRTFEICRRCTEAGVDAAAVARQVYDTGTLGRLRITGALLDTMHMAAGGRLAVLTLDERVLDETGATYDDAEGLINMPLGVADVQAVVMFKDGQPPLGPRVSLRSKGAIDVRSVALAYGGGGHHNAAGFTAPDDTPATLARIVAEVEAAIASASPSLEGPDSSEPADAPASSPAIQDPGSRRQAP